MILSSQLQYSNRRPGAQSDRSARITSTRAARNAGSADASTAAASNNLSRIPLGGPDRAFPESGPGSMVLYEKYFSGKSNRCFTPWIQWVPEMNTNVSPARLEGGLRGLLHAAALIAVLVGAVGSVGLMLYVGRHNDSRILLVLFTLWVLSPFVVLVLAYMISKRWSVLTRAALYTVMLVLTLGSLTIYGDVALGPPRAKTAFVFVVVPPASWLLIAIVVPIAALISGRASRQGANARDAKRQSLSRSR